MIHAHDLDLEECLYYYYCLKQQNALNYQSDDPINNISNNDSSITNNVWLSWPLTLYSFKDEMLRFNEWDIFGGRSVSEWWCE